MAIFVDENTKVVVVGLTGTQGSYYGLLNRSYGTQVVAGVNPKKVGTDVQGIPIRASVADAVAQDGANAAFIIVPAAVAGDAILEAAAGGVPFIVCVTEHITMHRQAEVFNTLKRDYPNTRLLGPNCSGILSAGKCNIGFTPTNVAMPGSVGIVSRSGTLAYQSIFELTQKGIGQTTCVGIGGDPVPGTSFIDCLRAFQADPETKGIIMIGEIGGSQEEEAAEFIKSNVTKPVVAYIAGVTAPPGRKMGHAGAIISGSKGTAKAKMEALSAVGVRVAQNPTQLGDLMAEALASV
jgi:succinyl-CoA synthetase alpha subunit